MAFIIILECFCCCPHLTMRTPRSREVKFPILKTGHLKSDVLRFSLSHAWVFNYPTWHLLLKAELKVKLHLFLENQAMLFPLQRVSWKMVVSPIPLLPDLCAFLRLRLPNKAGVWGTAGKIGCDVTRACAKRRWEPACCRLTESFTSVSQLKWPRWGSLGRRPRSRPLWAVALGRGAFNFYIWTSKTWKNPRSEAPQACLQSLSI